MRKTGVVMGVTCLASLLLLFVEPAEALDCTTEPDRPGCESATKVIRDLREKYGSLDDTIGCVTVAVVSEGAIPPNHCLRVVRFARNVRQEMIRFWNAQANGGWATIGPRPLEFNGSFDGRIVSRGTRMFITQVSVDENQVEILITKRGGRNPTNVTICLFDPEEGGRNTLVHSFQIPAGKGNRGRTWTYVVDDTFGRFMSVLLTGLAVDPRTLDYTLEARTSGGAPQVELAASAPETDPRPESSSAGDPFPAEPSAPEVLFGEKFREMTAAGYRLVDVEAYPVGPQTRYTGIWVKDGRTPWRERRDLTNRQYASWFEEMNSGGYRPTDIEVYERDGQTRYAAIWINNDEGLAWRSSRDLSSQAFGDRFQQLTREGYRIVDIEAYPSGDQTRYADIWVKGDGDLPWRERRDLDDGAYGRWFDQMRSAGYRPVDIEAYPRDGRTYYAAIWVRNEDGAAWRSSRDLSSREFGNRFEQLRREGYRLVDIEGYAAGGETKYADIWVKDGTNVPWREYRNLGRMGDPAGASAVGLARTGGR